MGCLCKWISENLGIILKKSLLSSNRKQCTYGLVALEFFFFLWMLFKLSVMQSLLCFMGRKWISQQFLRFLASFKKSKGFLVIFTEKFHPALQSPPRLNPCIRFCWKLSDALAAHCSYSFLSIYLILRGKMMLHQRKQQSCSSYINIKLIIWKEACMYLCFCCWKTFPTLLWRFWKTNFLIILLLNSKLKLTSKLWLERYFKEK